MNYPISLQESYILINNVLNSLIKREFGQQYSIRLNSLRFIENRNNFSSYHTCYEQITFKSSKPILFNELISIKEFILFSINSILISIDSKCYIEVTNVDIKIM
jgi:hypothetical protein